MRRVKFRALVVGAVCALAAGLGPAGSAAAATPAVGLALIASHLNQPVYATETPSDTSRVFIVQKGGLIRIAAERPDARDAVPEL